MRRYILFAWMQQRPLVCLVLEIAEQCAMLRQLYTALALSP
jgi:hypothetical protein